MSFYSIPPSHDADLHQLLVDIHCRLQFLHMLHQCYGDSATVERQLCKLTLASASDGLIEGTHRDCSAHYILRIAASENSSMREFFLRAEELLLLYRVQSCQSQLLACVTLIQEELTSAVDSAPPHLSLLQQVLQVMSSVVKLQCVRDAARCGTCILHVPWLLVPRLVSSRRVIICRGVCSVSCCDTPSLLGGMYYSLLQQEVQHMAGGGQGALLYNLHQHLHAELASIVNWFLQRHQLGPVTRGLTATLTPPLMADEVSGASTRFPPCMLQLHRHLSSVHRLQHHHRYRYSLFLKDIGVPLDQNILYWKGHYSVPGSHASCGHNWHQDSSRYIYSLRHMYGLEGARVQRHSHRCLHLQGLASQPGDCGGCPFASVTEGTPDTVTRDPTHGTNTVTRATINISSENESKTLNEPCRHTLNECRESDRRNVNKSLNNEFIETVLPGNDTRYSSYDSNSQDMTSSQTILVNTSDNATSARASTLLGRRRPATGQDTVTSPTTSQLRYSREKKEAVMSEAGSSSKVDELRRLLLACSVAPANLEGIISVALESKPSLACRMTMAAILEQRSRPKTRLAEDNTCCHDTTQRRKVYGNKFNNKSELFLENGAALKKQFIVDANRKCLLERRDNNDSRTNIVSYRPECMTRTPVLDCISDSHCDRGRPEWLTRSATWSVSRLVPADRGMCHNTLVRKMVRRSKSVLEPGASTPAPAVDPTLLFGIKPNQKLSEVSAAAGDDKKRFPRNRSIINEIDAITSRSNIKYSKGKTETEQLSECSKRRSSPTSLQQRSPCLEQESAATPLSVGASVLQAGEARTPWIHLALDPCDVTLAFTSPAQYYRLLQEKSSPLAEL